jgi:hypothetical protein
MKKILFLPFKVGASKLSVIVGKRVYDRLWSLIDGRTPPVPESRSASMGRLALSLGLQGAVFSVVRGLADNGSRRYFQKLTGRWPGKEPEAETQET